MTLAPGTAPDTTPDTGSGSSTAAATPGISAGLSWMASPETMARISATKKGVVPGISLAEAAVKILDQAVVDSVHRDAKPRPGQVGMLRDLVQAMNSDGGQALAEGPTGVGKALDVDTPIPTPDGWKRMGDLVRGDVIFDENGQPTTVTEAFEVRYDRPCFEVVFDDGAKIVADEEHLWATSTRALRALQAERRRAEQSSRKDSLGRYERYRKAAALAETFTNEGYMLTSFEVASMFEGLVPLSTIQRFAKQIYPERTYASNARCDMRPVVERAVSGLYKRSSLAKPPPAEFEVVTTAQILDSLRGQGGALNHAVQVAKPLSAPDARLLVDPYVLGVWLGDGTTTTNGLTSADVEIVNAVRSRGYDVRPNKGAYKWTINLPQGPARSRWEDCFIKHLREVGVLGNKHIPMTYLRASEAQRWELLRGLVDTDGTISVESGRCEITLTDKRLIEDVHALVLSLGLKPSFKSGPAAVTENGMRRVVGTRYRVGFTTSEAIACLSRKSELLPVGDRRQTTHLRYIAEVRPVASRPVRCIAVDSPNRLFLAGRDLIVTHNSFVYLSAAAAGVVARQERSVVSTESLALQAQIVDKDAPIIAAACETATGYRPKFAVLKGWSNYVCSQAAVDSANEWLSSIGRLGGDDPKDLADKVSKAVSAKGGMLFGDAKEKGALLAWAMKQVEGAGSEKFTGDKNAYPGTLTDSMLWDSVSVSSSDCLGADRCAFAEQCLPRAARQRAAEADVIVTNHHLLAVQAANDVPVVIGSRNLGPVHHVFVDEGHGLPQTVRGQGSVEVSARSIIGATRAVTKTLDDRDPQVKKWADDGEAVAKYVGDDLAAKARKIGRDGVLRLGDGEEPLENSYAVLEAWLKIGADMIKRAASANSSPAAEIGLKRAKGRLDGMKSAMELVSEHKAGCARWVEVVTPHMRANDQTPYPVVRYTPVDVASAIRRSLWTREMNEEELELVGFGPAPKKGSGTGAPGGPGGAGGPVDPGSGDPTAGEQQIPRIPLTSVVLSATMPNGFGRQVGIKAGLVKYPSPFDDAYGDSVLFVPRAVDPVDVEAVGSNNYGRWKFDTAKHRTWATGHMVNLVEANAGSALVLAATASSGREYAKALQAASKGRWKVLSQWDGGNLRNLVSDWKADKNAVLVGTRSLMTGVDAKGETCTLVIVDRPARAASNPVDDARVEALVKNAEMDKWMADRLVYVSDAGLLLEQAAGRLIRQVSDSGMVAVLDPRLLKVGPFSYPEPTRKAYMDTLHRFTKKMSVPEAAHSWLRERRAAAGH